MGQNIPKYNNEEINNVYAFNVKNEEIHISDAQSGRKGYYCLGCKREMQAVISIIVGRISYFRHDAQSVKGQPKCTYSDETYRHKLAKEILLSLKKIKVPPVYKFPPIGHEGKVYILSEARVVEAFSVGIERNFYEDENGQIHTQKSNIPINEKHLLIRPDVTFFDENEKPVLFIEIVVTHKLTDEKRIKLKRLGIDTVQIRVPKDSPQEIEKSFFNTQYLKWIHNNEEQRTEYISIPEGSSEGILPIDEEQRKLFAETSKCRAAQIKNLTRTIERCLESKLYRDIKGGLESELSRVEGNTERAGEKLSELQDKIRLGIEKQYRERRDKLAGEQTEFLNEEGMFQGYFKDLEGRYLAKRRFLEAKIRTAIEGIGGNGQSVEARRIDLEREATKVDGEIGYLQGGIEQIKRELGERQQYLRLHFESIEKFEAEEIEGIQTQFNELPNKFEKLENGLRAEFQYLEETERREIADIEKFENEFDNHLEQGRSELEGKFKNIREGVLKSVEIRDAGGNSEFAGKLKELIKNGTSLTHFEKAQWDNRRYRKGWECLNSGAYQNWNERK